MQLPGYTLHTSTDSVFFSRALNLILSVKFNSPSVVQIIVNDIGMSKFQLLILKKIRGVVINTIPHFNANWKDCFSWKIYAHCKSDEPIYFHLDAGNIVLKDLGGVYKTIEKDGYFFIDQGQVLKNILSKELVAVLENQSNIYCPVFAAGNIGMDKRNESIERALKQSYDLMVKGYNLGFSKCESSRDLTSVGIYHDVELFRHDQSVMNAAFYNNFSNIGMHKHEKYAAIKASNDVVTYNKRGLDYSYIGCLKFGLFLLPYLLFVDAYFKIKINCIKFIKLLKGKFNK